jgi:hypothetical protein
MNRSRSKRPCLSEDVPLGKMLLKLRPKISIEVVRSIRGRVSRSHECAHWLGRQIDAPHPAVGIATAVDFLPSSRLCSAKTVIGNQQNPFKCKAQYYGRSGKTKTPERRRNHVDASSIAAVRS